MSANVLRVKFTGGGGRVLSPVVKLDANGANGTPSRSFRPAVVRTW